MIRPLAPKGSLRDVIYRQKNPRISFFRKYLVSRNKGLDAKTTKLFARQILEVSCDLDCRAEELVLRIDVRLH